MRQYWIHPDRDAKFAFDIPDDSVPISVAWRCPKCPDSWITSVDVDAKLFTCGRGHSTREVLISEQIAHPLPALRYTIEAGLTDAVVILFDGDKQTVVAGIEVKR